MKFTRQNLIQAWHTLNGLSNLKTTAKGAYGIAKNIRLIRVEIESIQEARNKIKLPEVFEEYEKKRVALCEEYADKNEDGSVVQANGPNGPVFKITERNDEFLKVLNPLNEEYKDAINEKEKIEKEFADFMNEEIDYEFHAIKAEDFPNEMSAQQMSVLGDIVTE